MYTAFVTSDFGLGAATQTKDELIEGARLEWSSMFAIDPSKMSNFSWSGVEPEDQIFKRLSGELRGAMEAMGLQGVQFKTITTRTMNSNYRNQIVVEMTTPMNRRLKADLRWDLEQLAKQVGLNVDPNPAHNNLRVMKQGVVGGVPAGAPAQPGTGDNYTPQKNNNNGTPPECGFLCALGITTPFAIAGGVLLAVILFRK